LRERAALMGDTVEQGAEAVRRRAGDLASAASEKAGDIASSVSEKAGDIASTVSEKAGDIAATVSEKASDFATSVTDKASALAGRVGDAAEAGRARVADTAGAAYRGVRREVGHYGEAARREISDNGGRYGLLLGAIGVTLAAAAIGAARVAAARNEASRAAPLRPSRARSKAPVPGGQQGGSFGTSEDAFIGRLRDIDPADEAAFVEDSAIATEDVVGDTEPATHGGELFVGQESESSKPRGRKRAGSGE